MILLYFLIVSFHYFSRVELKLFKSDSCNSGYCINEDSAFDPNSYITEIQSQTNAVLKDALLNSLKSTLKEMDLPDEVKLKLLDDKFLEEKINKHMKIEFNSESEIIKVKAATYDGSKRISNWEDFYRYFPQYKRNIRLWKLRFKEEAKNNWDKFDSCANPSKLGDWLVPDIEEVQKSSRAIDKKEKLFKIHTNIY